MYIHTRRLVSVCNLEFWVGTVDFSVIHLRAQVIVLEPITNFDIHNIQIKTSVNTLCCLQRLVDGIVEDVEPPMKCTEMYMYMYIRVHVLVNHPMWYDVCMLENALHKNCIALVHMSHCIQGYIRESVDSLCSDGTDMPRPSYT